MKKKKDEKWKEFRYFYKISRFITFLQQQIIHKNGVQRKKGGNFVVF